MDKKVSFAVCDDDEIVCEAICDKIKKYLRKCGLAYSIDKYISPVALYKNIEDCVRVYDALFLDIDMPKLNGLELAAALKKNKDGQQPDIIFVSNREDKVFEAFSVRPFGFVRKSNFSNDLMDTLRSYVNTRVIQNACIAVKTNNNSTVRKVKISDIVYIESYRNKQNVNLVNQEVIECRMSMEEFEEKLAAYDIVRVYKGYLVNLKYVKRIERTGILLDYGEGININVSRDKLQELKETYMNYLRKIGAVLFE
ncbi:MAG: response regulator transcription factor [Clostridia bacterium]|nr:response regulator transcription factor [Clostridia bacterium]